MVGALFLLSLRQLGQSLVLFLITSVGTRLGLALANERLYLPYSVSSHNTTGECMLAISIAIDTLQANIHPSLSDLLNRAALLPQSRNIPYEW
jgi:hypothetical protein